MGLGDMMWWGTKLFMPFVALTFVAMLMLPPDNEEGQMEDEKDDTIELPYGFNDGVYDHQHMVVKGENVYTCKVTVMDPMKKVGQSVVCGNCGRSFKVVKVS
jgi:hypothetical protein